MQQHIIVISKEHILHVSKSSIHGFMFTFHFFLWDMSTSGTPRSYKLIKTSSFTRRNMSMCQTLNLTMWVKRDWVVSTFLPCNFPMICGCVCVCVRERMLYACMYMYILLFWNAALFLILRMESNLQLTHPANFILFPCAST